MTEPRYTVVRNDAGQYSIWPSDRTPPPGWTEQGFTGTEQECSDHVDEVWTGLDPASLRVRRG